jgi:hypothetical protein
MILFGVAEVMTSFTGNFLGVFSTSPSSASTYVGAAAGSCYVAGGLFTLTMKKWGAALGIVFIGAEIAGRVYLVMSGLYPFNGADAGGIIAGTAIAVVFAVYIALRWNKFN